MPLPQDHPDRAKLVARAAKVPLKAIVNLGACTGCEVCIAVCPVEGCIDKFGDEPATTGVFVNYDVCIGCRLCAKDCPWDTIRMVPSASVKGHATSLDTQPNKEHAIYQHAELVPAEVRGFVDKPVFTEPTAAPLFAQQNKEVPGMMSPK
jgi:Pyruvate/2-oxoacid:ferredoxin oxidoreductase delta subunit